MRKNLFKLLFLWLVIVGVYHVYKPLPTGVNYASPVYSLPAEQITFFADYTYIDSTGERISEQQIFDEVLRMIDNAQEYILLDFFFYSDFIGIETDAYRILAAELTTALLSKKQAHPDITIQVITDPINVMYGGHQSEFFTALEAAGIPVVITDLRPLRDSNPIYSALWRTAFQWFGVSDSPGYLPNPLDANSPKLGLRTYLRMLNYKANHRKVLVADFKRNNQTGLATLLTSANPHDGSSAHSNIAVRVDSKVWQDVLVSESAVAEFSGHTFIPPTMEVSPTLDAPQGGTIAAQFLTEGAMEKRVLQELAHTKTGDTIRLAMFYLADRDVIEALKDADERGVRIQLLLDPNKDAFGREKNGAPNRQVAHELLQHTKGNTVVRWCNTHGEQCHSKLLIINSDTQRTVLLGSTNYTRRNMDNFNLESNLVLSANREVAGLSEAELFFDRQWNNEGGREYSVSYEHYADDSWFALMLYRLQESTGVSRW